MLGEGVKQIDYSRVIPDAPVHRGFDRFFGTAGCPGRLRHIFRRASKADVEVMVGRIDDRCPPVEGGQVGTSVTVNATYQMTR